MSITGLVDIHSHLLHGIDDGCRTLEESLACVRMQMDYGFIGTVCTPHMAIRDFRENIPAKIAEQVRVLQEQLRGYGLEYQLWSGGELRIAEDTLVWLREFGVPALGPSRHVLIDYWGTEWPDYADPIIDHLLEEGRLPILAHPERMDFEDREWEAVLRRLQHRGVGLQGNLRCLAGREGPNVAERARRLLREDRYLVLATDMHGTPDLPDRLAGLSTVLEQVGAAKLRELLVNAPQRMVALEQ